VAEGLEGGTDVTNRQEIKKLGAYLEEVTGGEIGLTTYSPGDGMTRYRIGRRGESPHDYFGDYEICTALGAREAVVMLRAYLAALLHW
jgi:hypothetical protein